MAYDKDYGVCKFCGEKMVHNPKTDKVFCSAKCWLKKPGAYTPDQAKSAEIKGFQESKEASMRIMSSGRDATLMVVAEMAVGIPQDEVAWNEDVIKRHIKKWQVYFYDEIYSDKPF